MRMAANQLASKGIGNVVNGEAAGFGGHLGVKKNLKQHITEFFL